MSTKMVSGLVFGVGTLLFAWPMAAQNTNKLTFYLGAGLTQPSQYTGNHLDTGFHVATGGGYYFLPRIGILGEFGYDQLGVNTNQLASLGVPNGSMRIYSVTANPIVHLNPRGRFDTYVIGGGGYYRRTIELTEPSIMAVPVFDPFIGAAFPMVVPVDRVLASFTQNKGGLNIGGGMTFRLRGDGDTKLFLETRYHYAFTTPKATNMIPVTFGLRW